MPPRIWAFEDRAFTRRWREDGSEGTEYVRADHVSDLIRTATEFVEELNLFGFGASPDLPLPGAYDPFLAALEKVKR